MECHVYFLEWRVVHLTLNLLLTVCAAWWSPADGGPPLRPPPLPPASQVLHVAATDAASVGAVVHSSNVSVAATATLGATAAVFAAGVPFVSAVPAAASFPFVIAVLAACSVLGLTFCPHVLAAHDADLREGAAANCLFAWSADASSVAAFWIVGAPPHLLPLPPGLPPCPLHQDQPSSTPLHIPRNSERANESQQKIQNCRGTCEKSVLNWFTSRI